MKGSERYRKAKTCIYDVGRTNWFRLGCCVDAGLAQSYLKRQQGAGGGSKCAAGHHVTNTLLEESLNVYTSCILPQTAVWWVGLARPIMNGILVQFTSGFSLVSSSVVWVWLTFPFIRNSKEKSTLMCFCACDDFTCTTLWIPLYWSFYFSKRNKCPIVQILNLQSVTFKCKYLRNMTRLQNVTLCSCKESHTISYIVFNTYHHTSVVQLWYM